MEQKILKQHLVKLLFEEYKFDSQIQELRNIGIELSGLEVNNLPFILDIIGFPPEKSFTVNQRRFDDEGKNLIKSKSSTDEDFFCRDDYVNKFYNLGIEFREQKKVMVTDKSLRIVPEIDTPEIEKAIMEYIDWLYDELAKLGKKPE